MKLRQSNIDRLDARDFDVLIVGGGINGAVSASSLTSRGARVALIDREDFASGTSQESSNLIWGGIKYLENFEMGLVWKLCKSRNHLLKAYPATVREVRFLASVPKEFRKPRWMIAAGAWLYWGMGRFFTKRPRSLSKKAVKAREPVVNVADTTGAVEYSDAYLVDNDARFVFRFIREALNHGGIIANYVESLGATWDGQWWTTRARDRMSGREITIRSRALVNACGPLVDQHNTLTGEQTSHRHIYSKGVHLIVDRLTREQRVLAFFASDGRLFFVIPLGARSCIGTTDTRVTELPAVVTDEDRRFILDNINALLDLERPLTEADVIAERCGVRPLVVSNRGAKKGVDDDTEWTALSRKHAVDVDRERRHVSIYGGKLTDCVNVGDEVAEILRGLGVEMPYFDYRWYGEEPDAVRDEFFHQAQLMGLDEMTHPASSEMLSTRLWRRYGGSALELIEDIRVDPSMGEILIEGTEYIRAEIAHAARAEMITRLEDFLRRRSKIALVVRDDVIRASTGLHKACRILFGDEAEAKYAEYFGDSSDERTVANG